MNTPPSETPTKYAALIEQLEARRKANVGIRRVDDASLRAGSPMHFYCNVCGAEIVVPEIYTSRPTDCLECIELKKLSTLPSESEIAEYTEFDQELLTCKLVLNDVLNGVPVNHDDALFTAKGMIREMGAGSVRRS